MINSLVTGYKIRTKMIAKGFDVYRFSKKMGVTTKSIYKWFEGVYLPTLDSLYRISRILDCTLDELVGTDEELTDDMRIRMYEGTNRKHIKRKDGMNTLYAVVDPYDHEQTLFVGNVEEVAEFAGVKKKSVFEQLSRARKKGVECKYIRIGTEEELEELED